MAVAVAHHRVAAAHQVLPPVVGVLIQVPQIQMIHQVAQIVQAVVRAVLVRPVILAPHALHAPVFPSDITTVKSGWQ